MKKVGRLPWKLWSCNTWEHQRRVFNFVPDGQRKLVVSEIFIGEKAEVGRVNTDVDCKCSDDCFVSCCPFAGKILVMAGDYRATDFFCALVSIDPGELTKESIHVEEKKVTGWKRYESMPYLAQISKDKIWASFHWSDGIWIGEIKGEAIVMTKHPDHLSTEKGFCAPPLQLPGGRLLAAGGWPDSTSIVFITAGEQFSFEKVENMPRKENTCVSTILIKERFVLGFGGSYNSDVDEMWIFDLKTHKVSAVNKEGEWHPGGPRPVLVVRDKELYVIGGGTASAYCISFSALSRLIQRSKVKRAFCSWLGFPLQPGKGLERSTVIDCIPILL